MRVGANTSPKPATLVAPDEPLHVEEPPDPFVSRAGRKLDAAIDVFDVKVRGRRAIDVGASTGGFTDCLLQRGADSVLALDVGYGQMHWRGRSDERVQVVERTNIRLADPRELGAPFDLIVADLSFISLRTVQSHLAALGGVGATWVLLIKPQFEVGRDLVGRGGIVRDAAIRIEVLATVLASFADIGLGCIGLMESPITGMTGNVEYLACFRRGRGTVTSRTIESALDGMSA